MLIFEEFLKKDCEKQITINIVGDVIIDEYYYVKADRISPEFPIPVLQSNSNKPTHCLPGGAGNVALQLQDFNVKVRLFGFIDDYAEQVLQIHGISTEFCVKVPCVPVKKRLYSRDGQFALCRWDFEDFSEDERYYNCYSYQLKALRQMLASKFIDQKSDVTILSDYNKGIFLEDIQPWMQGVVIVDPKKGPLSKWHGCYIIKPNAKEAKELTGLPSSQAQCEKILKETGCFGVVITSSGDGFGCRSLTEPYSIYANEKPTAADSVIGAGDCFIAFLAMANARDFTLKDAARIAYEAGSLYVHRRHNEPVTKMDIKKKLIPSKAKFATVEEIVKIQGCKVFTNGCFDILHAGHLQTLNYAKSLGDVLIVGVNDDESVRRLKGDGRPVIDICHRMQMVAALEVVDFVVSFSEDTPFNLIQALKPDILVKGSDYAVDQIVGRDLVTEVRTCPLVPDISTTKIIEKLKK